MALECSELVTLEMQRRKGYNQPRKNKKQTTCLFKQIAPFLVMQQRFWIAISTSCSNPAIAARIRTSSSGLEQEASAKVVKSRLVACRFNSTSAKNSSSVTEPWNGRLMQSLPGENAKFMTGQPTPAPEIAGLMKGFIDHWFPLIRPRKPLFLGGHVRG